MWSKRDQHHQTQSHVWLLCRRHQNSQVKTERTRLTVGGDQIEYPGDKSTITAGLSIAKMLFNSTISTPGAKFLVIDIKNFYLNTPLARYEYMVIMMASLPQEVIDEYSLDDLAVDGKVYIEIQKGMYGLPQAGILAHELFQRHLSQDGYRPTNHTHGLWTHDTRPITFSLVVEDFVVKYVGQEHADHLKSSIENIIKSLVIGQGVRIAVSSWIGITKIDVLIYPCQATSRQPCTNSNIHHQRAFKMHRTHGAHPYVAPKHSTLRNTETALYLLRRTSHAFNNYLAQNYIMRGT
jgi:hypothetical protein